MGDLISQDVINRWKKHLSAIASAEEIKIVSGELNCDLYRAVKEEIYKAASQNDAVFKIIGGPLVSIEEDTGSNAVIELFNDGYVTLWIAPYRQLSHFQVFGMRFVFRENYHDPLEKERDGIYFNDLISISKYSYDFDNIIKSFNLRAYDGSNGIVKAHRKDLLKIKEKAGHRYDFLGADEIKSTAAEFGITLK